MRTFLGRVLKALTGREVDYSVDTSWYLNTYPDVAQAKVNPLKHFLRYGQYEGRVPAPFLAPVLLHHSVRGLTHLALPQLHELLAKHGVNGDGLYALQALVFHCYQGKQFFKAISLASSHIPKLPRSSFVSVSIVHVVMLCAIELKTTTVIEQASKWLFKNAPRFYQNIARVNLAAQQEHRSVWQSSVNTLFQKAGRSIVLLPERKTNIFDALSVKPTVKKALPRFVQRLASKPLVSVIVPAFNAENTIATALRSIHQQCWPNIEIIIVDDASADKTALVCQAFIAKRNRPGRNYRFIQLAENGGAYAARNRGAIEAQGAFVTVHDADDWSHPKKLFHQLEPLLRKQELKATVSHWLRISDEGIVQPWQVSYHWVHRNVSSLMVRRSVLNRLGVWDEVKANADTEYYYRFLAWYGSNALLEVKPGIPLALGRVHRHSLTQSADIGTHTQFLGPRKQYLDAAMRWHLSAQWSASLKLEPAQKVRPFRAPEALLCRPQEVEQSSVLDLVQQSKWFDPVFYMESNPNLLAERTEAYDHWLSIGETVGLNPSSMFSSSGYRYCYFEGAQGFKPLQHFMGVGKEHGCQPLPSIENAQNKQPSLDSVVVFGSVQTSTEEDSRTLIEIVKVIVERNTNVHLILSYALNKEAMQHLEGLVWRISFIPLLPWLPGRSLNEQVLANIQHQLAIGAVNYSAFIALGQAHFEPLAIANDASSPALVLKVSKFEVPSYIVEQNSYEVELLAMQRQYNAVVSEVNQQCYVAETIVEFLQAYN